MANFTIYGSNNVAKAVVKELELHDEWMAECYLTISVKSATPIAFAVGDYIDYRGERYTIQYDPNVLKKATSGSYGEGFTYDNIKFVGLQDEVVRCDFNDIVLNDNDIHYSALPTFPFYCESVDDLLDRIQANLEDLYPGQWIIIGLNTVRNAQRGTAVGRTQAFLNAYKQYIDPTGAANTDPYGKQGVAETADNITCWDAMKKVHDDFDLNFIVRGRVIVVGTAGVFTANTFRYGKGNGLYELERIGESDQRIVTRLRAYGSEQNLPAHYYNTINKQVYATVTSILHKFDTTGADFLLDLDFDRKYFTYRSESYPGTTEAPNYIIEMMANDVTVRGYVTKDATTGKCYVYCESVAGDDDRDEPDASKMAAFVQALTANDRLDFVEYVNKDAFGEGHYDYGTGHLPDNMAVSRLMLPGFPTMSLHAWVQAHKDDADKAWLAQAIADGFTFSNEVYRPYIDSPNKTQYGVRPGSIYFDGSDDTEDVHPTIEGMTYNGAPIDEVYAADQVEDNGVYPAGEEVKNIKITLPVLGFELDKVYEDGASIDMKNGMCGARSFKMAGTPKKDANGRWVCTVERVHDDALDLWFPYCDFQIHGSSETGRQHGDNYVLTGIDMPTAYIEAASVRLLQESIEALKKNHAPRYTYQPRIDELWMQRQHDTAISSQGVVSLHDTLKAGDIFAFADTDLNIDANVIIDVLTIRENGNNGIPTYEVTLRDDKQVGTIQKITNKVDSIISGATQVNGAGGGLTARQVQSLIDRFGGEQFLSKLNDDTAEGYIKMLKGLQIGNYFASGILGEGGVLRKRAEDGKVELEVDILYARMKAYFDTVEVREYQHTGGNRIASVAGNRICRVEWYDANNQVLEQTSANLSSVAYFRCYFRASDGEDTVRNNWVVGDMAYCHVTSIANSSDNPEQKGLNQKHLWRLVIGRNADNVLTEDGEGYIDLSNRSTETISSESYAGYQSGSDAPSAQDDIIQLGNVNDTTRQGAIVEFVTGTDAPSYQIYQGIGQKVGSDASSIYSLTSKNQISIGYNTATGKADMKVYGDAYIGARDRSTFIEYKQDDGTQQHAPVLNIKAHVEFTNSDQELNTLVQSHQRDDSYDDSWIQPALNELQNQIDGQIDSWFYNYSPVHVDAQGAPDSTVPLNVEPYSDWDTDDKKIAHLGDTFTNNTTGYCWRFSRNSETNAFEWVIIEDSAVITALQNAARAQETADGKRTTYSVWGAWVKNNVNTLKTGDLFIPAADTTQGGVTYKARKVYKCTTDGSATFSEINYTDDTYAHNFDYLKAAMKGDTQIQGGLLLSNAVVLRNVEQGVSTDIMSGINGVLNTDLVNPLKSIAAWYGGDMLDREAASDSSSSSSEEEEEPRYATSLFRFDGSGYLASGNITWNDQGQITIKNITTLSDSQNTNLLNELATFNSAFHFTTGGQGGTTILSIDPQVQFSSLHIGGSTDDYLAATRKWVGDNYISKTWFNKFFKVHYKNNGTDAVLDPNNDFPAEATDKNIEAIFSFWTNYAISALGQGVDGSHAIGSLDDLSDVELTTPATDQILKFDGTHWVNAAAPQTYVLPQATANALGGIKIGYSGTGKNYPLVLNNDGQAYVNVPWTDHYAWGDISNKPTTISGYGITDAYTKAQVDSLARLKSVALASDGVLAFELQDGSVSYADLTHQHDFQEILDKPTTLAGFGITDAKIESGVITLGGNTITPVTSVAMTVPTGFSISGTPISKIGTLTLSYSSGYEGFTTDLKNMITALYSWFEVDSNGDIKTKDYTSNGTTKHRGFWSPTFISALGQGNDGGGGGQGDVTWELLKSQATNDRYIHLSYISTALASYLAANNYIQSSAISDMATKTWVGNQGYLTQQSLSNYYTKSQVDALARLTNVAYSSDGILAFTHQDGSTTYADFTHEHSFLELLDKPTTIAGYEISDAYINNGVVYLGNNSITPVTSVAMTVPTGFSISGSPISKTGTLAVSYASGYEGFTTSLKGKIEALFSWFELDSDGNVKTKDYYDNGTIKHRGFWSESFISALGEGNDGGGGGQGDVTWELLKQADTRPINISHLTGALSGYATQSWVTSQGYVTTSGMNTAINALTYLNSVSLNNDGSVVFGGHGIENTILDLSHQHSFLELLDRPTTITGYGITDAITTSNIGSQSVSYATSAGDASTLGGTAKGGLFTSLSSASDTKLSITIGGTTKTLSTLYASYAAQLTSAVNLYIADSDATNTGAAVSFSGASNVTLKLPSTIKATLSGNATTATTAAKLSTTSKTAWGRTFWTAGGVPDSISGALESVTNIEMSGYIKIGTIYIGEDSNGNLEIYKLNNGSHVAANLYARGGVSALGQSSSGGGGGQGDVTWDLLKSSDTRQINISHLAGDANYAGVMSILTGYTTSGKNYKVQEDSNHHLYVNVPWTDNNTTYTNGTGLSLSGTTFSINSTYQTYISNGNTAYGWGNHASAGYALQTSLNALEYFNSITGGSDIITITTNKSNSTVIDLTHQHSFQELTDKPTTIAGYGITDVYSWARQSTKPSYAFSEITGTATANQIPSIQNINSFGTYVYSAQISRTANTVLAAPNGSAGVASFRSLAAADIPSLDWSKIGSGKPTTLSGYGITDACTQSTANGLLYTMSLNNDGTINVITLGGTTKYSIDFTHQHSFLELVDRPTTTDGYGITGGKMTGNLYVLGNVGIGTSSPSYKLHVNGESYFANWMFVNSSVTALGIELQPSSSSAGHGGHIDFHYNKSSADYTTRLIEDASGRLKLIGDFYATGGVTALVATSSDIRKKNVVSYDLPLTLNQIADAPTIKFTWKDNAKLGEQVGSIAQYWQKVLPQTIRTEKDDTLSLQYGVAALVATITTARKVVDHEKEIAKLKERVSALEKENELLKLKIA